MDKARCASGLAYAVELLWYESGMPRGFLVRSTFTSDIWFLTSVVRARSWDVFTGWMRSNGKLTGKKILWKHEGGEHMISSFLFWAFTLTIRGNELRLNLLCFRSDYTVTHFTVRVHLGVPAAVISWPVRSTVHTTSENSPTVIKPTAATLSVLRPACAAAVNRWEIKVHEIIDACLKGWQLCETEGGSRTGLLIRRVQFKIFPETRFVVKSY